MLSSLVLLLCSLSHHSPLSRPSSSYTYSVSVLSPPSWCSAGKSRRSSSEEVFALGGLVVVGGLVLLVLTLFSLVLSLLSSSSDVLSLPHTLRVPCVFPRPSSLVLSGVDCLSAVALYPFPYHARATVLIEMRSSPLSRPRGPEVSRPQRGLQGLGPLQPAGGLGLVPSLSVEVFTVLLH